MVALHIILPKSEHATERCSLLYLFGSEELSRCGVTAKYKLHLTYSSRYCAGPVRLLEQWTVSERAVEELSSIQQQQLKRKQGRDQISESLQPVLRAARSCAPPVGLGCVWTSLSINLKHNS